MNIYGYHTANTRPISSVYAHDQEAVVDNINDYTTDGLDMNFSPILSGAKDVTTNHHNTLVLTNKKKTENVISVVPVKPQFPYFRQTYIKQQSGDVFLVAQHSTGSTTLTGTSAAIANPYFFEIEFLTPLHCAVRYYDNTVLRYLTLTTGNTGALTFTVRNSADFHERDTQIFRYVLDESAHTVTLLQRLSTSNDSTYNYVIEKVGTTLSARKILPTATSPFTTSNTWEIRPIRKAPLDLDLKTTWISYLSAIDENSALVDTSASISNLQNNYLVSTQTDTVGFSSKEMAVNIMPLKNQVTIEGSISRNNPYSSTEDEVTHREYHKLHTGTYEEFGNDSIYMSHTSSVKGIKMNPDSVTYFHIPHNFEPYTQLNINDSTFAKAGAIAGDSPLKSDKIFKNLKEQHGKVPKDELNGTWLCSWLSGAPDSNTSPIWVDRFYKPEFTSQSDALSSGLLKPVMYVDKFESVTKVIGASSENVKVYDKASDFVFEPGLLYAYHHVGRGNAQKIIDSHIDSRLSDGLETYTNFNGVDQIPLTDVNESTHAMEDGKLMTGIRHQANSINVPLLYQFDKNNVGITERIKSSGSFTLNFWLWSKDWSKPIGDQLIGNYVNKGFGVYNEPFVTPFTVIPDGKSVHVYNSDSKYIDTHFLDKTIKHIVKKGSTDNFWIMDSNNDIYEYNVDGVTLNKISSSHLTNKNVVDLDVSEHNIYALIQPPVGGTTAQFFTYDLTNRVAGYAGTLTTENIWNPAVGTSRAAYRLHSVKTGLSAGQGVLIVRQESLSGTTATADPLTGTVVFGSGSTVDIYGSPWVVQNNYIYTYDRSVSANIKAISANKIIEGVQSDRDGNIWVLHDHSNVSKFDNDRNLLFTSSLSAVIPVSSVGYNRYIDFISEFNNNGYESYAVIYNQSLSGCKAVTIDSAGETRSFTTMLTGSSRTQTDIVTFFQTPLVSSFALSGCSWKSTTGYDYLKKHKLNNTSRIDAKLSVSNKYNSSTSTHSYSAYTLSFNTSGIGRGWHNFNISLNAETGLYQMYVDAHLVDQTHIHPGRYSFDEIFDQPLTVGSSPYFTNLILGEHLDQKQHYLTSGLMFKNIKLYSKPLRYFDILSHYTVLVDTTPIKWDIPSGQRNYIDTIERVFKHKIPGRKSELVDINIKNTLLTDSTLKADLREKIVDQLAGVLPAITRVRQIGFDGSYVTALTSTSTETSVRVVTEQKTDTPSTTQTTQGGVNYGY